MKEVKMSEKHESEFLRNDSKSLLYSLRKHQNVVNDSLHRFKAEEKEEEDCFVNNVNNEFDEGHSQFDDVIDGDDDDLLLSVNLKKVSSVKTVSFSDYPRTLGSNYASPRRRSRSVSPFLGLINKTPTKSILKKQLVQDELSDDDLNGVFNLKNKRHSNSSVCSNASTNSLLCSDIYGGFKNEEEFDDNLRELMHMADSDVKANKSKFIDLITQKRQMYLSHEYDEGGEQVKHLSKKLDENRLTKSVEASQWSRSYSADIERRSPVDNCANTDKKSKASVNMISRRLGSNKLKELKKACLAKQPKTPVKNEKETNPAQNRPTSATVANKETKNENLKKEKNRNYKKLASQIRKQKPLLGYDWAVDALETKRTSTIHKSDKPEEYWQELSNFRSQFKEDCVSSKQANFDGTSFFDMDSNSNLTTATIDHNQLKNNEKNFESEDGRNHQCIHTYTLNERLFPVPMYKGKNGQSACPVCKSTRKEATSYAPQFCKISIPKSRIVEPYKIEPKKRVDQTNTEETLSLAEHCVAGYQTAPKKGLNSYNPAKSKNIDLKSATGISNEVSKLTIEDVKRIQQNRDPAFSGVYNKAHAMRYELEDQHLKRLRELAPKINS